MFGERIDGETILMTAKEKFLDYQIAGRPSFAFRSYGVRVHLTADDVDLLQTGIRVAKKALVGRLNEIDCSSQDADHRFSLHRSADGGFYIGDDGAETAPMADEIAFARLLNAMIRANVAAKAKRFVFLHAGVVTVAGRAIVLPGDSYSGKTRLVAELIRRGATYFSDEYAVMDERGMIHPFDRDLSLRPDGGHVPYDVRPEDLGANRGGGPTAAAMLILTKYEPGAAWLPERISLGQAILEIVPKCIGIASNPEFHLNVLHRTFECSIILKSPRGDTPETAKRILQAFYKLPAPKGSGRLI